MSHAMVLLKLCPHTALNILTAQAVFVKMYDRGQELILRKDEEERETM